MKASFKTRIRLVCLLALGCSNIGIARAQVKTQKPVIAVAGVETVLTANNRNMLADIARFELIRMDTFQVLDRYDHA